MKKFIKSNIKLVIGIVIGLIIAGTTVYAATVISGSDVSYSNTSSDLTSTNVQGAIDEVYNKVKNNTFKTNTAKTVYASSKGVCIERNNKLNCFKRNNWAVEKDHVQQVFSDVSCSVDSSYVECYVPSNFYCYVESSGFISCTDESDSSYCDVFSDGSVNCS